MNQKRFLMLAAGCAVVYLLAGCATAPRVDEFAATLPEDVPSAEASNGSIYQSGHDVALFENSVARRVGDTVTVNLVESTAAQKSASTTTSKATKIDLPTPTLAGAGIKLHGKAHWAIGVVRWVTVFEDGGMEFGLQYLAQMARAVQVKAWGAPSAMGLLLADDGQTASTLLTSPNTFQHQQELELEDDGDACMVQAGEVVEVTHRFEIFTVKAP